MPNLKSLKILKKLMQEQGLLKQLEKVGETQTIKPLAYTKKEGLHEFSPEELKNAFATRDRLNNLDEQAMSDAYKQIRKENYQARRKDSSIPSIDELPLKERPQAAQDYYNLQQDKDDVASTIRNAREILAREEAAKTRFPSSYPSTFPEYDVPYRRRMLEMKNDPNEPFHDIAKDQFERIRTLLEKKRSSK